MPQPLLLLAPNRVRRNYLGGATLDRWEGSPAPPDGDRPEDWLASDVTAVNGGSPFIPEEGLGRIQTPDGKIIPLATFLMSDPRFYLGSRHIARLGLRLGFLAKLLDAAVRLPIQAHPTTAFARKHLGAPCGKLEFYVVLGIRPGMQGALRLGFQRPPTPQEWKRIVTEQDLTAMEACFDPVPVEPGDIWMVPGGWPHAIGEGIFLLEVMEPSDLVVRCEYQRQGVVVPPGGRFMGKSIDLALRAFDYRARSIPHVLASCRLQPQRVSAFEESLVGASHTHCFAVVRWQISSSVRFPHVDRIRLGVVSAGQGRISVGRQILSLVPGTRFLIASGQCGRLDSSDGTLEILVCSPGEKDDNTPSVER